MNVPAMIVLAGVILVEKVWRYGELFSIAVGIVLLVMAALAPFTHVVAAGPSGCADADDVSPTRRRSRRPRRRRS